MQDLFVIQHSYLIPLLPLIGAIVAGFFGTKLLKQQSHWPIWIGVGASAVLSLTLLFGMLAKSHEGADAHRAAIPTVSHDAHGNEVVSGGTPRDTADMGGRLTVVKNYFSW